MGTACNNKGNYSVIYPLCNNKGNYSTIYQLCNNKGNYSTVQYIHCVIIRAITVQYNISIVYARLVKPVKV